MKITEITVGASRTINTGNYNSTRVEGSVTATLDPDDVDSNYMISPNVITRLNDEVLNQMRATYKLIAGQDLPG